MNTTPVQDHIRAMFLARKLRCDTPFCGGTAIAESKHFDDRGQPTESRYHCRRCAKAFEPQGNTKLTIKRK